LLFGTPAAAAQARATNILPVKMLAAENFGNDAPWFEKNVPFFEISDPEIQQIYYYRWKLYKSHLRDLGDRGYIVTEFLDDVGWDKHPYASLNDATAFHIYEGRWLKDNRYIDDYINYMYTGGGNDRHFSEGIADAVYARYLVNGNSTFATKHLDVMQHIFNLWDDHFDFSKGLYFIEPLLDATEYTISSVDASGGKDGFRGGDSFRPTINSYMFANSVAISKLSALAGDDLTAVRFADRAARIKATVEASLWNSSLEHFTDRYQVNNQYVHYWDFIRGRELAGYVPWVFNLPGNDPKFSASWKHLISSAKFLGPYGLRTNEPSYEYYMRQYRYDKPTGKPECEWNGPSWPFQTTQVLVGMANLLNNYSQGVVHVGDYLKLLQLYTHQHLLNGKPNLQEDYNPDDGKVIVGLPRSSHYNHSDYNDLIITGLIGLRPRADDILEVNPLVSSDPRDGSFIRYFCLENVSYHGHLVTVVYDVDGKRYRQGAGLSIYLDGKRVSGPAPLGKKAVAMKAAAAPKSSYPLNLAVNIYRKDFPVPMASTNNDPAILYQAVDGRIWFYPEMRNGWTTEGSTNLSDWYSVDFGQARWLSSVALYFYGDGAQFKPPAVYNLQSWSGTEWVDAPHQEKTPAMPVENGENTVTFSRMQASKVRVVFANPGNGAAISLVEIKAF
jgi:hypothetical protein